MIVLAACYFVAGALAGAWVMRLVMPPPSALPSPVAAPTLTLSIPTPLPAAKASISASMFGWDPTRAVLPTPKFTPGDAIPGATTAAVCTPGWATEHRHVTEEMRARVYAEYGLPYGGDEVDHLVPLELGGSNDLKNLWPQPYSCAQKPLCGTNYDPRPGAGEKDQLENELHHLVCSGRMTLTDAQHCIASNWVACWEKYMLPEYGSK